MINFLIAAAVATAPAAACPAVVTPEALVCRALQAKAAGDPAAAAQGFEEAAQAAQDKDPAKARMWAAAGNLWGREGRRSAPAQPRWHGRNTS